MRKSSGSNRESEGFAPQRWAAIASLSLLCATIILSPLPFGSVGDPAIVVWVVVLGASVVLVSFQHQRFSQPKLLVPLWTFCLCWIAVIYLQNSSSNRISNSITNPNWAKTADILGMQLEAIPAAVRSQSMISQGPVLLAVLALSSGIVLGSTDKYAKSILAAFAWSGLFYAIFGIASYLIDPSKMLGIYKDAYVSELTATFYNRNTAAIYFGSCAIVWLMLLLQKMKKMKRMRSPNDGAIRAHLGPLKNWLLPATALLICLVAMFMTRSRAGSLSSIAGLTIALIAFYTQSFPSKSSLLVVSVGILFGAGLLIQLLGAGVTERLSIDGISDDGRLQAYRSTMQMIESAPWLGTGSGSFPWVFPAYRSPAISSWGVWDRAHNTFLELTAEMGIPIAVLVVVGWVAMLGVLYRGATTRLHGVGRPSTALGVLLAATLHSMVDFPLQIPAFSIVVFAIVGVGLSQSLRWREFDRPTLKPVNSACI